jgi:hypothetical protein
MAGVNLWSVTLVSSRCRRRRWLGTNGHFTSDPAMALRLVSPEVAVKRLQTYMALRGWPHEAMERFQLVPAPEIPGTKPHGSSAVA